MSNRHVERRVASEPDNEERWLLTYSDMITLLLALFVVLFALSSINKMKFVEFSTGVRQALSSHVTPLPSGSTGLLHQTSLVNRLGTIHPPQPVPVKQSTAPPPTSANNLAHLAAEIHSALAAHGLLSAVNITLTADQLKIRLLADRTFFATNSDALSAKGAAVVDTVGGVLVRDDNVVDVNGYTDSTPVTGGPFYSNYMLSAARAVSVVERFVHQDGIAEGRLQATAFGSTHPAVPNTTPANQARNRRVDIVILGMNQ
jgi:chemotaxis protein MotB